MYPNSTSADNTGNIPQNYFCNWTFSIDSTNTYSMLITRTRKYAAEQLSMRLKSDTNEDNLTDSFL